MEINQAGMRLEQTLISTIGDTWEMSFLLYLIPLTEVNGLPPADYMFSLSEGLGIGVAVHIKLLKTKSVQKENKLSQPTLPLVCEPSCSATSQVAAQQALSEQKDEILIFSSLPSINADMFLLSSQFSRHLKHLSWQ